MTENLQRRIIWILLCLSPVPHFNQEKLDEALKEMLVGFPGGAVVRNPPVNAGDTGSSPGPGRSHMPRSG